jgi:regulator of protease activity HflC (stomatin/prohibitin superfamily)
MEALIVISVILLILVFMGFKIVPQQQSWILERLGKFNKILDPGLNFIIPFVDVIAYKHSLKELTIDVQAQTAITQDNVTILLDGIVYIKVVDPKAASYGVSDPIYAVTQLAQTTMRSEIGKMSMDKTFEERNTLNANIVMSINEAAINWGVQCMRYELKDITPPQRVLDAMELQVAAERQKRADILNSEGKRQAQINSAQAFKESVVLESEGSYQDQVNRAKGEAEAIILVAEANAKSIEIISEAIARNDGEKAVSMKIAEQYVDAFSKLAKESNTMIIPASTGDASGAIAQALSIYQNIVKK